jgi:hypothetical protein
MIEFLGPLCRDLHLKLNRILQAPDLYASDVDPRYDLDPYYRRDLVSFIARLIELNSDPVLMLNRMLNGKPVAAECTYVEAVAQKLDEWKRRWPGDKNGLIESLSQAVDDTNGKERPQLYEFLRTSLSPAFAPGLR